MRLTLLLGLAGLATSAHAVPMEFSHQGRLMDPTGLPLDGTYELTLELYDAPSGGTAAWSESLTSVEFDDGYYSVVLGAGTPLDAATFDDDDMYLSIAVDAGPPLPGRVRLRTVPYAIRAANADRAAVATAAESVAGGGSVDAGEVLVNGTTVIDSSGNIDYGAITGAPQALGSLGCTSGAIVVFDGASWTCGVANAHEHSAADITTGTLDIGRVPIGTGALEVAAGDHGHTANDVGALPAGTTAADIGGLPATATASDIGGLMAGTTTASDVGALPDTATAADIGALPDTATAADVGALPDTATAADVGALPDTTTAADLGALDLTGGQISGDLDIEGNLEVGDQDVMTMLRLANARAICYGGVGAGQSGTFSIIVLPWNSGGGSYENQCTSRINSGWHSCGVAKANYFTQNCGSITNESYGGGYTSFVRDAYANGQSWSNCDAENLYICCSPQCSSAW